MFCDRHNFLMLWIQKSKSFISFKLRHVSAVWLLSIAECVQFHISIYPLAGGDIKIYRKDGLRAFQLTAEANDPDPLPVEYISFGSYQTNRVQFYFNCSFSFATPDSVSTATDHPLLAKEDVPPSVDLRNCKLNGSHDLHHHVCAKLINFSLALQSWSPNAISIRFRTTIIRNSLSSQILSILNRTAILLELSYICWVLAMRT